MQDVFSTTEIQRRLLLWNAIAELWLDAKPDEATYNNVAKKIVDSGYSIEEVERIYYEEVAPAVYHNLYSVAGEWAGFDDDWLRERILKNLQKQQTNFLYRLFVKSRFGQDVMTKSVADSWIRIIERYKQITASQYSSHKSR